MLYSEIIAVHPKTTYQVISVDDYNDSTNLDIRQLSWNAKVRRPISKN
jgi:hypothetical protein